MISRTFANLVNVEYEPDTKQTRSVGGVDLNVNITYNPFARGNLEQSGIVTALPDILDSGDEVILEIGDTVYVNHNIVEKKRYEGVYQIRYDQIYAYRRNKILFAMPGFNLLKPMMEDEDDVTKLGLKLKAGKDEKTTYGLATGHRTMDPEVTAQGVEEGDVVMFRKGGRYILDIDGERYIRARTRSVISSMKLA